MRDKHWAQHGVLYLHLAPDPCSVLVNFATAHGTLLAQVGELLPPGGKGLGGREGLTHT